MGPGISKIGFSAFGVGFKIVFKGEDVTSK